MKNVFVFTIIGIIVVFFASTFISCGSYIAPQKEKNNYPKTFSSKKSSATKKTPNNKPNNETTSKLSGTYFPQVVQLYQQTFSSIKNLQSKLAVFHPYVVHFPIVLIFLAPIFWLINYLNPRPEFLYVAKLFLLLGFVSIVLTMLTGYGEPSTRKQEIILEWHTIWGELVVWSVGIALAIRIFFKKWSIKPWYHFSIILFLILANLALWVAVSFDNNLLGF